MGTENVKLGICSINYKAADLGLTKGGSELAYVPEYRSITVDQFGNTPINDYLIGENVTAVVTLAEHTLATLKTACPVATEVVDGAKTKLTFGSAPGKELLSKAGVLILHPIAMAADTSMDITLYKAVIASEVRLPFKLDGETVYQVTFKGLIDETKSDGNYLFCIGDSTASADLVAPIVSSIVPNTGASGVDKAITTTVQVEFDKAMDPDTIIADNLHVFREDTLAAVAGTWSYLSATHKAVFTPDAEWAASTEFIVQVSTGVRSANHVAMAAWYVSNFTTGA